MASICAKTYNLILFLHWFSFVLRVSSTLFFNFPHLNISFMFLPYSNQKNNNLNNNINNLNNNDRLYSYTVISRSHPELHLRVRPRPLCLLLLD